MPGRNETKNDAIKRLEERIALLEQKNKNSTVSRATSYLLSKIPSSQQAKNVAYSTKKGTAYGIALGFFISSIFYVLYQHHLQLEAAIPPKHSKYCERPGKICDGNNMGLLFDPQFYVDGIETSGPLFKESDALFLLSLCAAISFPVLGAVSGLCYGIFSEYRNAALATKAEAAIEQSRMKNK